MISVVVITYNQESLVARCLESILQQKCSHPFEIVLADDASSDGTPAICQRFADQNPDRIRLFLNKENKGIVSNYYDCVRACRGNFLMDCAGDDEWMPGRMQQCIDIMERYPQVATVCSDLQKREEPSGVLINEQEERWNEGLYPGEELTYGWAGMIGAPKGYPAMMRLSALRDMMQLHPQFFSGRRYRLDDLQMVVMMGLKGKMYYLPQPTFYYSVGVNNVSAVTRDALRRFNFEENALMLIVDLMEALQLDRSRLMPALQHRTWLLLMDAFRMNDKSLRQQVIVETNQWGIPLTSRKLKAVLFVTSSPVIWNMMLKIRKLLGKQS